MGSYDHGRNSNLKLCRPQQVSKIKSRMPFFQFLILSLTIRCRLTPPIACSTRIRKEEIHWLMCLSKSDNSLPRGFFFGWIITMSSRENPWKPVSCAKRHPFGRLYPLSSASFLSFFLPSTVSVRKTMRQAVLAMTLFLTVCCFFYHYSIASVAHSHSVVESVVLFHHENREYLVHPIRYPPFSWLATALT